MILDQELSGARLAERIRGYCADPGALARMAAAARALGRPDAAARIVEECYALAHA
jgi:UDP-N-acetylglucosamine:LPS N-acetylglucosamine transferase